MRKYLSSHETATSVEAAREAFEAALTFMAYYAASEAAHAGKLGNKMLAFQHRSMGPLKALLKTSLDCLGDDAAFTRTFKSLYFKYQKEMDIAIGDFTDQKHNKLSADSVSWIDHVELLVKIVIDSMKDQYFGYTIKSEQSFLDSCYDISLRVAHDNSPFVETINFRSPENLQRNLALVVDLNAGKAMSLSPFYVWWDQKRSSMPFGCFVYDKPLESEDFAIKPCDEEVVQSASEKHEDYRRALEMLHSTGKVMGTTLNIQKM